MRHQRRFWPDGEPTPGVTAAYGMLRKPDLTHEQADAHWRDTHAPLALRHHPGMWHYHQVSIDEVLDGLSSTGSRCARSPPSRSWPSGSSAAPTTSRSSGPTWRSSRTWRPHPGGCA